MKFKFSKAVQELIDSTKDVDVSKNEVLDTVKITSKISGISTTVTHKIFKIAVKAIKDGVATFETAKFAAEVSAEEIRYLTRGVDKEIKKAAYVENLIVEIATEKTEAKKSTKKEVMARAWVIAKEAAVKFSGSSKAYIAEAMKMAWAGK